MLDKYNIKVTDTYVMDLCAAPGSFVQVLLQWNIRMVVTFTMPEEFGGLTYIVHDPNVTLNLMNICQMDLTAVYLDNL